MKEVICYVRMIMMNDSDELTLRPTEDYAFKRLFGWEDGKRSLMSLLNAILDGNPVIEDVKILNTALDNQEV